VQDYSCVGPNLAGALPPTADLDDRCVHETDRNYHTGVDMGAQADADGIAYAAAPGTIIALTKDCAAADKRCNHGLGNEVVVRHGPRLLTRYSHLASVDPRLAVNCSARPDCTSEVSRGDVLGKMGSTGNAKGAQVHFDTFVNAAARIYDYDTDAPVLDGFLDPWGIVASTAVAPAVIEVAGSQGAVLRRGPGNNYSAFARVKAGDRYVAFAEYAGWFRVHVPCVYGDGSSNDGTKYNSCAGWINESDIAVLAGAPNLSIPYGVDAVSVKAMPNNRRGANVLAQVVAGQRLGILATQAAQPRDGCNATPGSTWYRIALPTKLAGDPDSGWVCGDATAATASVDQANLDCSECFNGMSVESYQSVAQLFTVERGGLLSRVDVGLYATAGTATDVVVDLLPAASLATMNCNELPCSGRDLGQSLFRTRVVVESLQTCTNGPSGCVEGPGTGFVSIDVRAAGLSVNPGDTFAIVLTRPGGTTGPNWVISQAMEGPPHEGRDACASSPWISSAYGKSWVCYPELPIHPSMRFRTWVE
jgi:peptidase M23-like protein